MLNGENAAITAIYIFLILISFAFIFFLVQEEKMIKI